MKFDSVEARSTVGLMMNKALAVPILPISATILMQVGKAAIGSGRKQLTSGRSRYLLDGRVWAGDVFPVVAHKQAQVMSFEVWHSRILQFRNFEPARGKPISKRSDLTLNDWLRSRDADPVVSYEMLKSFSVKVQQ